MPSNAKQLAPRAAIYARYSSDNQSPASIDDQVRICRAAIERHGWHLAQVYRDHALSGTSTLRPGYQKLLEDARSGAVDMVVSEGLDRLSRDQADIAVLYKQLSYLDIRLWTVAEGDISALHVGLKGTMNDLYIKDLAQKTHRGLEGRVRNGMSGGGNAYGYDVVRGFGPDGMPVAGRRRINSAEAAVVIRIFEAYAAGRSARRIAHDLNATGVRAPRRQSWGASTISGNVARGTGILNNELYVGRLVWNRQRYPKNPETRRRVSRQNDAASWVTSEVPELRIVSDELWDRVKARQKAMRCDTRPDVRARPCDRRRPRYLLSGLIVCGQCGGRYTKLSAALFGCAAARNKGATVCTNLVNVRHDRLEAMVLDALRNQLMEPELFKAFCAEFTRVLNDERDHEAARREQIAEQLNQVERRIRRIVDAIAEGTPARALRAELLALEEQQERLQAELGATPEAEPTRLAPEHGRDLPAEGRRAA